MIYQCQRIRHCAFGFRSARSSFTVTTKMKVVLLLASWLLISMINCAEANPLPDVIIQVHQEVGSACNFGCGCPQATAVPTTAAPTTVAPTTIAPTTAAPTTANPTTVAPTPDPGITCYTCNNWSGDYPNCGDSNYDGNTSTYNPNEHNLVGCSMYIYGGLVWRGFLNEEQGNTHDPCQRDVDFGATSCWCPDNKCNNYLCEECFN